MIKTLNQCEREITEIFYHDKKLSKFFEQAGRLRVLKGKDYRSWWLDAILVINEELEKEGTD
jgi:hypothetical protein